jgi:hypothetical protein
MNKNTNMKNELQLIIQGLPISSEEINQINHLIDEHPDWSRWRLSTHLSKIWDWRNSRGQIRTWLAAPYYSNWNN